MPQAAAKERGECWLTVLEVSRIADDYANALFPVRPMKRLLASARKAYDVILIKTPPVLTVPQAALLGHASDLCLHIAPSKRTPRRVILSSFARLRNAGVRITGVILTEVSPKEYKHHAASDSDLLRLGGCLNDHPGVGTE